MSSESNDNVGPTRDRREKPSRAFSLVELIVVIVIIGLLAGIVAVRTRSYLVKSKQNAAKVEIAKIVQALDAYYGPTGRYPTNEEGLEVLVEPSDDFVDGLLSKIPQDPWGNNYVYILPGRDSPFDVYSLGADGREGGEGADQDIRSDQL